MRKEAIILATLAALLFWLVLPVLPASAHANLVSAKPAAGDALATFPAIVQLTFSEAVAPDSTRVLLYNASAELIARGQVRLEPGKPDSIQITLPRQPDGVYSIRWQVQSAVDGHITLGTIAFSVGAQVARASLLPPSGTPDPTESLPNAWDVLLRGLGYISISLLAGTLLFGLLVWRPALRAAPAGLEQWDTYFTRLAHLLMFLGTIGVSTSLFGVWVWQQVQLSASGDPALIENRLIQGQVTRTVWIFWTQLGILFVLANLTHSLPTAQKGGGARWWVSAGLAAALLATYPMSGHAAAFPTPAPVIIDWLHLASMAPWIGGLLILALLALRQQQQAREGAPQTSTAGPLIARVTRRFSRLAMVCVGLLGLTGIASALWQVQTVEALLNTRYGQALLLKSALFSLLIALGALNQLRLLPRLEDQRQISLSLPSRKPLYAPRAAARALAWLGRTVRLELGLALLLLFIVGGLVSLIPGKQALEASYRLGAHGSYRENGVSIDFRAAPARPGENQFGVEVSDSRPGANRVSPTVLLRIQAADGNGGVTQVQAKPDGPGHYSARGSYLATMGVWKVQVIWRKTGYDDITHVFSIDLNQIAAERGAEAQLKQPDTP